MNKNWRLYLLFAALPVIMAGCGSDPFFIPVESIEGVPSTGTTGEPLTLTGRVNPGFASKTAIVWTVWDAGNTGANLNRNILSTETNGTVTIQAKIAGGAADGKDYIKDFNIEFKLVKLEKIEVTKQPRSTYTEGDLLDLSGLEVKLTYTDSSTIVEFKNFWYYDITTEPKNGAQLSANDNGRYVTISVGGCTAYTSNLTVSGGTTPGVPVAKVTLNPTNLPSLTVGDTATLTAIIEPANANNQNVTWSTNNNNISINAVENNCTITAVAVGTATITVTADGGNTATCTVTVDGFTTIEDMKVWLYTQPQNNIAEPYRIKLNVSDIADIHDALSSNPGKYVNLDLSGSDITSIGNNTFEECYYLTSVTIGDKVKTIGEKAFSGCSNLTSVTIGKSVTSIGPGAFNGCSSLTSVTINCTINTAADLAGLPDGLSAAYHLSPGGGPGTYTLQDNGSTWIKK